MTPAWQWPARQQHGRGAAALGVEQRRTCTRCLGLGAATMAAAEQWRTWDTAAAVAAAETRHFRRLTSPPPEAIGAAWGAAAQSGGQTAAHTHTPLRAAATRAACVAAVPAWAAAHAETTLAAALPISDVPPLRWLGLRPGQWQVRWE